MALIFPLHPWVDVRHYGRLGGDGGVDILAKERVEDGVERVWFIQCRRHSRASQGTLTQAVDDTLAKTGAAPNVLLVVLACDVTRAAHESFRRYASAKGVKTPLLWTASVLEARLHSERRDLLFSYFGISEAAEAREQEASISRNIALKKRLRKDLLADPKSVNWDKARKHPPDKFEHSEVIVHSIDDMSYPDVDSESTGISGWFKLEVWDYYHNGLEFVLRVERGARDSEGYWAVLEHDQQFNTERFTEIRIFLIGRIPYRNIVDYDVIGDEYYPQPHLYCRFANGGEPYEGFRYVLISDEYPWPLEPELQVDLRKNSAATRPNKALEPATHVATPPARS